ncbi:MAG: type I 3-dehydroquinate dehydratase [Bacteroidales bacterium]|nr:type I 3-dehydroquinate dehydratase [Bacteroidales bacterium]
MKICASIGEKVFGKCRELLSLYSFCEIRGDLCGLSLKEVEELLDLNTNVIFTYRFSETGKKTSLEQTLLAIKKGVWAVDLDLGVPAPYLSKVRKAIAKQPGTKLIISWHSDSTPSLEELVDIVEDCKKKGADIVKVAPTAKNLEEASRVLRLYFSDVIERERLIAFAQGEAGRWTRLACLSLGSPVSYASAGKATAPGQSSYEEMAREVPATFRIGDISQSGLFSRKKHACVCVPCSKSIVQRAILAAAITNGQCVLRNFEPCEDIKAAIAFVRRCGCLVKATRDGNSARGEKMLIIRSAGIAKWKSFQTAEAGQSALLLRMLLPVCAYASSLRNRTVISSRITVTGSGSLAGRNLSSDIQSLKTAGVKCLGTNTLKGTTIPVTLSGASFRKTFTISGKDTSQTVTGLLMVLPLLHHDTGLTVEEASSIPYIDLTVKVLMAFGIRLEYEREGRTLHFNIEGRQGYSPVDMFLESDWSGAANFLVLGSICGKLTVKKMHPYSSQADESILEVLSQCGVSIKTEKTDRSEFVTVSDYRYDTRKQYYQNLSNITVEADHLKAFSFDATDCPDLFPILTTLAVYCNGTSRIKGVHRLVNKESNRAESILLEFSRMGYHLHIEDYELVVEGNGGKALDGEDKIFCSSHNDHRIAMAIIICAMLRNCFNAKPAEVFLDDIECIGKSFPTFVERLQFNTQKT